jgi:RimJ/RimL family protein N-acetyltransferase
VPEDFVVRTAVEADARAIAEIHVADWRWAYKGLVPDGLLDSLSVDRREEMWRRGFARGRAGWAVFVAERDGTVIGFVGCGPGMDDDAGDETGEVYAIYLRPDVVGTGVGRALFARATDHLRQFGFRRATLWVLANNARTRRFYEIAGWRPDGTEKLQDWDGHQLHEVRYEIDLGGD